MTRTIAQYLAADHVADLLREADRVRLADAARGSLRHRVLGRPGRWATVRAFLGRRVRAQRRSVASAGSVTA